MAYTLRQLIDMIRTVPDARTALQKLNDKVEGLGGGNSGGGGGPSIASTDSLPEGSINLYFSPQRVRNTSLTGLVTTDNSDVVANDTVLSGIGKLQAKSASYGTSVTYNIGSTGSTIPLLSGANTWSEAQTFSAGMIGNSSTASAWQTARTLSATGDATWSISVNGSANVSAALTLADSGVVAGTYPKVRVDAKGRVTAGAALLASDVPTLNQSTTGNAATATKLQTARTIALTGFAIGSGSFDGSDNLSIATTGSISNATESTAGIAQIATSAQARALTDNTTIMTPAKIPTAFNASGSAPLYACRAWVNFNGVNNTIVGSGNVSSITDNGTGDYTINFTTAMQDTNYTISGNATQNAGSLSSSANILSLKNATNGVLANKSTTSFTIVTVDNSSDACFDSNNVSVAVFR